MQVDNRRGPQFPRRNQNNREIRDKEEISSRINGEDNKETTIRIKIGILMEITFLVLIVEYQDTGKAQLVSYGVNTGMKEKSISFNIMIGKIEIQMSKVDLLHNLMQ